ncbi:hypothetical protein CLOP_g17037 [Closterium sp. NIES-67]|nr:hypothetical protein CLOP_g17037 [Closterium sp. NIES-67]
MASPGRFSGSKLNGGSFGLHRSSRSPLVFLVAFTLFNQAYALPSDLVTRDSSTHPTVTLRNDILREDLASAFLYYHRDTWPDEIKVQCQGAICPDLGSCGPNFPNLRACHQPEIADRETVFPGQPENCPGKTKLTPEEAADVAAAAAIAPDTVTGRAGAAGLPCAHGHRQDYFSHERYVAQYFEMKDVLMSASGLVFNESMHFSRQGCHADGQFHYKAKDSKVIELDQLVSFVYHQGGNYYHSLVDLLPQFYIMRDFLKAHPNIPIAFKKTQLAFYRRVLKHVIGVMPYEFNLLTTQDQDTTTLYRTSRLYQPVFQTCGNPSPSLWHTLRSRFLLPPNGLPMFSEAWEIRNPIQELAGAAGAKGKIKLGSWNKEQMSKLPRDWVVVLGQRPGSDRRRLVGFDALLSAMEQLFTPERVVVYDGSIPILQAKALFNRGAAYVAPHGAGLANMIFMPSGSSVLEIRPDRLPNACYHHLASACDLHYSLVMGNGTVSSPLSFDMREVRVALDGVARHTFARDAELQNW